MSIGPSCTCFRSFSNNSDIWRNLKFHIRRRFIFRTGVWYKTIRIYYLYYNSPYGFCLSLSLSVLLIWGLYRPSSEPIALRNVLKCPTRHTLHIIRFWHFSSAAFVEKKQQTTQNKWGDCSRAELRQQLSTVMISEGSVC